MEQIIEGSVESIIYQNEINGYTVFSLAPEKKGKDEPDTITCTANMAQINIGEHARLTGSFVLHPVYGRQFNVTSYQNSVPSGLAGLVRYLGSGVIKGVGEKTAQRIVDKFGKDSVSIIENRPEKLATVRGISLEKALSIGVIFKEHSELRNSIIYLQEIGISPAYAKRIFDRYKSNTIDIVKNNPYILANEINGIGFKMADAIALRLGMDPSSPQRLKSGVVYTLNTASSNGHVYLPKEELLFLSSEQLNTEEQEIENVLVQMQFERSIWQEKIDGRTIVYLNSYYYAESYTAKKLLELTQNVLDKSAKVAKDIEEIEKTEGIYLAQNQKKAIEEAMSSGVLVITGGPGTGKTTAINTIIKLMEKEGYEIQLAAPTGRAAKRMTEATGMDAMTIHRLLGMGYSEDNDKRQTFEKNEDNPIEADVIIIDESSMVDSLLMYYLLKAVPFGARLILVGDVDQLPSVGAGNVLKDIINSGEIKVVRLTEVFRQAQESAIIMNAHRINKGEYPIINEKNSDFFFMKRTNAETVVNTIVELVTSRLPKYGKSSKSNIQILTPMRKSLLGVINLNIVLQQALNPPSTSKREKEMRNYTLREGDKVMQIKNNYNMAWRVTSKSGKELESGTGIFNGDEGIIKSIDDILEVLTVVFDGSRTVNYDYSQLEELELSYAVTIHKSQGSEYETVIIPILSGPPMLMSRNLLYTAVTRAKKLAVIVGIPETLNAMVDNAREVCRYSTLCHRIIKMNKFLGENKQDKQDK